MVSFRKNETTAPVLHIGAVRKSFKNNLVLDNCSIDISENEIVTLLGPSGCGKTTLLRCIAGFTDADIGSINIDGQDMSNVPVNKRPVGVVFQSYALFPHLTVFQNILYPLRMLGTNRGEALNRVDKVLQTVSLKGFEKRYPAQLSGGQQQRVAIARVLVMEPRVLLLDEPFNALDAKLRSTMQVELRQLIKRLGRTAIFVTHDQEEALTMSDRVAIMRAGKIEQVATPDEIYDRPKTAYVAEFIGASNFLKAKVEKNQIKLPDGQILKTDHEGIVQVMVRPQNLAIEMSKTGNWKGTIIYQRNIGPLVEYHVETVEGANLKIVAARLESSLKFSDGSKVKINIIKSELCIIFAL